MQRARGTKVRPSQHLHIFFGPQCGLEVGCSNRPTGHRHQTCFHPEIPFYVAAKLWISDGLYQCSCFWSSNWHRQSIAVWIHSQRCDRVPGIEDTHHLAGQRLEGHNLAALKPDENVARISGLAHRCDRPDACPNGNPDPSGRIRRCQDCLLGSLAYGKLGVVDDGGSPGSLRAQHRGHQLERARRSRSALAELGGDTHQGAVAQTIAYLLSRPAARRANRCKFRHRTRRCQGSEETHLPRRPGRRVQPWSSRSCRPGPAELHSRRDCQRAA